MVRANAVASLVLIAGCSFGIRKQPAAELQAQQEPACSESYVRPGFDGTMAGFAALGGGLAALQLSDHGCDGMTSYGSRSVPCSSYVGLFSALAVVGGLFTAGAVYGAKHASHCEVLNDRYERLPRYVEAAWSPELTTACEQEREALLANAQTDEERTRLAADVTCGPRRVRAKSRARYHGGASNGVGAAFIVGTISLLTGVAIFVNNTPPGY
jgi:hypothetical protein